MKRHIGIGWMLALVLSGVGAGAAAAERYRVETIEHGPAWVTPDALLGALASLVADKPTARFARKMYANPDGTFTVEEPTYGLGGQTYPLAHWRLGGKEAKQSHLEGICRYFGLKDARSFLPSAKEELREYVEMKADGTLKEIHAVPAGYILRDLAIPALVVCGERG